MTHKRKKSTDKLESTAPASLSLKRQPRTEKRVRTPKAKTRAPLQKRERLLTREARVRILIAVISAAATLMSEPIRVAAAQYLGHDLRVQSQCQSQERN